MKTNTIYNGDALEVLKTFTDESINMCMTSPPYWRLRDYGVEGQLGLEKTFNEYIDKLCNIFDEVKRVLKDDGTCWVNLGDTYGTSSGIGDRSKTKQATVRGSTFYDDTGKHGVKGFEKSLCMIPFRFAIEMVNRGWILRNTVIWHKPSCMPSSAEDRFTVDFEYLFFFAKNKKYYFDQQKEPIAESSMNDTRRGRIPSQNAKWDGYQNQTIGKIKSFAYIEEGGRNKRCVWSINTQPFPESHFATYPEELCITPIKAGSRENDIVLDPFCGAGTTLMTAKKLNRQYIGIELNPDYIKMAEKRIEAEVGLLF